VSISNDLLDAIDTRVRDGVPWDLVTIVLSLQTLQSILWEDARAVNIEARTLFGRRYLVLPGVPDGEFVVSTPTGPEGIDENGLLDAFAREKVASRLGVPVIDLGEMPLVKYRKLVEEFVENMTVGDMDDWASYRRRRRWER
jgi:hypothetical protein